MFDKSIGEISYQQFSKKQLIELIEKAFPDDEGGNIGAITTIVNRDYKKGTTKYIQSIILNGVLGYDN